MLRSFVRHYRIGIMLSVAWFAGATAVLNQQRATEVLRQTQQCHQIQDDARSNQLCAEASSVRDEALCRYKDANCDRWPLEEERFIKSIALLAVGPVALAWVIFCGLSKMFRRSSKS